MTNATEQKVLTNLVFDKLGINSGSVLPKPAFEKKLGEYAYELGQIELGSKRHLFIGDVRSLIERELSKKVAQRRTISVLCDIAYNMDAIIMNAGALEVVRETIK